jgi:hypothetical protein
MSKEANPHLPRPYSHPYAAGFGLGTGNAVYPFDISG